jgi:hypothetical protein
MCRLDRERRDFGEDPARCFGTINFVLCRNAPGTHVIDCPLTCGGTGHK